MGTSSGTETVTQNSEPWSQAQPYLSDIFRQSQNLYRQGAEYYPGSTVVPFSPDTQAGMSGLRQQFQQGPMGLDTMQNTFNRVSQGTNTAGVTQAGAATNPYTGQIAAQAGQSNPFAGQIAQAGGSANPFMNQLAQGAGSNPYTDQLANVSGQANPYTNQLVSAGQVANDAGAGVLNDFASNGQNNPYLDRIFDNAAERVRDNTSAMFSKAGRYGSVAHQDALSDSLGDMAANMYGQAYETDANRRFSAAQALGQRQQGDISRNMAGLSQAAGLSNQDVSRNLSGLSAAAGLAGQDMSRNFSGLGQAAGLAESGAGRNLSALNAAAGLNAQDRQMGLGALSTAGGMAGQDMSRNLSAQQAALGLQQSGNAQAMQAASMYPQLNEYAQSPYRGMMGLGSMQEAKAGEYLQDSINRFNFGQNAGWDLLNRYNQVVQPLAGMGGSTTGTQPSSGPSTLQTVAGLGMMGMGMFSDQRLKTDITPLGQRKGHKWYQYRYIWDSPEIVREGVMAQEIEQTNPEAVERDASGFLKVKYGALGLKPIMINAKQFIERGTL